MDVDAVDDSIKNDEESNPALGNFEKFQSYLFESESNLTRVEAAMILMSFSYGSAVIILPNMVLKLGPVTWMIFTAMITVIIGYCSYLNNESTTYLLEERTSDDILRDPYPAIAELASGPTFRKIVTVLMYVAMLSNSIAYMLLAASLMNDACAFSGMSHYNSIRVWICILCIAVAPVMYCGNLSDLKGAAIFAISASSVSLLTVFINCMYARYHYDITMDKNLGEPYGSSSSEVFIIFGLIAFALSGPSFAIPNITVHVAERKKLPITLAYLFLIIFGIYTFAGTVPYVVFGRETSAMVTTSFTEVMKKYGDKATFRAFTVICDVSMSLHLLLEAVLVINPLYQHIEDSLNIPRNLTWKRIPVRSCGLLIILCICLAIPQFRVVLSIVGGVPLTLLGVIFPLYIHTKIFDTAILTTILHVVVAVFFAVFIIGNFAVTMLNIVFYLVNSYGSLTSPTASGPPSH